MAVEFKPTGPQRVRFDDALKSLLMAENLNGTQWAIEQLRQQAAADGEHLGADALRSVADWLDGLLDKRAAELAKREG